AGGMLGSVAIWLTIPFSALVGWAYMSLDQVGEASANPFEGGANDVPISQICRDIEIELRTGLGEADLPAPLPPVNDITTYQRRGIGLRRRLAPGPDPVMRRSQLNDRRVQSGLTVPESLAALPLSHGRVLEAAAMSRFLILLGGELLRT